MGGCGRFWRLFVFLVAVALPPGCEKQFAACSDVMQLAVSHFDCLQSASRVPQVHVPLRAQMQQQNRQKCEVVKATLRRRCRAVLKSGARTLVQVAASTLARTVISTHRCFLLGDGCRQVVHRRERNVLG